MVFNMTELPLMNWSPEQLEAARKLCTDGIIRGMELPTILPIDDVIDIRNMAVDAEMAAAIHHPDAIIIQGEPIFVYEFVNACKEEIPQISCYSPCYKDGKFIQFRRF